MNNYRFSTATFFYWLSFLVLLAIYITHAPHTVQTGDSGELTAAAYRLLTPHPPGYPIWVWLNHFWISIVSIGTIYFSFSLFNIILGLVTLGLLGANISSMPAKIFAILSLGLSATFWRYVEVPEVFILNTLFVFATIWAGNSEKNIPGTKVPVAATIMPFFYSLGVANHHTIIFLLPYVVWACWKNKKNPWLYLSISAGIAMCIGIYLSMIWMNPDHLYSWHGLYSAKDVWNHFIRKDYGTFVLASHSQNEHPIIIYHLLGRKMLFATLPLLLVTLITLVEKIRQKSKINWQPFQLGILMSIISFIVIFMPMMNLIPLNFGEEVSERFMILPISLTILLFGSFISLNTSFKSKSKTVVSSSLVLLILAFFYWDTSRYNDFSDNTIIEDYADNLLNISAEFPNPILFTSQDTHLFAARYLQTVLNVQPQVFTTTHAFFAAEWSMRKIAKNFPTLKFDVDKIIASKAINTETDLIVPNLDKFTFITGDDDFSHGTLRLTYLPLGIVISKGNGFDIHKTKFLPRFRSDASIINTSFYSFNSFRNIFVKYSYYFVAEGMIAYKNGNLEQAIDSFNRALSIAPYAVQPLENMCKIKKSLKKDDPRCSHIEEVRQFFDYYQYNRFR